MISPGILGLTLLAVTVISGKDASNSPPFAYL
nr:MAG TPA: hypothetical protein [Caudoviricetes sp.]